MAMGRAPEALLLDENGDLQDIRGMLDELGVDLVRSDPIDPSRLQRSRLLVATASQALRLDPQLCTSLRVGGASADASARMVRIAVLDGDSKTLQGSLRERGFDYLVRRPVHPVALRLLLLRSLYRGDERRVAERLPIGSAVVYRTGLRRRPALLVDLSTRGCRLLAPRDAEPDTPITLSLPKELTGRGAISLSGWVLRCECDESESPDRQFWIAVVFDDLSPATDQLLREFLGSRASGPDRIPSQELPPPPPVRENERRAVRDTVRSHFRKAPRRHFKGKVAALKSRGDAMRTLIGRNLSMGGMLVEAHPELAAGDKLSLAIFGAPGERIVVQAEVLRSDTGDGLALRFDPAPPEVRQQLERLLQGLPSVEQLGDGAGRVVGSIEARAHRGRSRR